MKPVTVIAAIPNFNMGQSLQELLPQVLAQGYDAVYVLDDASRDDSVAIARGFTGVQVIAGKRNRGASGNRNRILSIKEQWPRAFIHFMDADVRLVSQHNPDTIRRLMQDETIGILGGLIYDEHGVQLPFNFGPRISLAWILGGIPQYYWAHNIVRPRLARKGLPLKPARPGRTWPDIRTEPIAQDVHYVLEGNMVMHLKTLEKIGGFHPTLRFNEAQDLSDRIIASRLRVRFDPLLSVRHLAIDVRGRQRYIEGLTTSWQLLRKSGWRLR